MKRLLTLTSGLLAVALSTPALPASAAQKTKRVSGPVTRSISPSNQANTPVLRIAGAATYRPPVQKAIEDSLNSGFTFGYVGSQYRPTASIYNGTLKTSGQAVIIETYWTGDLAGVVDVAKQNTITKWISTSDATLAQLTTGGKVFTSSYTTENAIPDVAVTVSFASSSAAAVSTSNAAGVAAAKTILSTNFVNAGTPAKAGGAQTVGLAAFQWVLGKISTTATGLPTYNYTVINTDGAPNTKTATTVPFGNITQSQAFAVIAGPVPLSYFTNNSADVNKYALAVGRSEDAGARTVPFAEAQTGFGGPTQQYQLAFTNNVTNQSTPDNLPTGGLGATVSGIKLWPATAALNTEPTIDWATPGHSGYNLTSDLANVLSASNPVAAGSFTLANTPAGATHFYFVGYNGVADTKTLTDNGGTALTYNGVPYSQNAVRNGSYSLWSFAHLYYIGSGNGALTGAPKNAANDIADNIFTLDADINGNGAHDSVTGAGIFFDASVLVTRSVEGGYVAPVTY